MSTTNRHVYDWKKIEDLRSQGVPWRKMTDPTIYLCDCKGDHSSLHRAWKKHRKAINDPNFVMDKRFKKKRLLRLNRMSI